ncbi:MBL fold metallo-hydrolase [Novosphingobium subterraneum]|uniref:MBL fold metallo-hydrolase n=1 Tax=Novosphingobium subterraneum TaxID=48936 RepID=UPI003D050EF6
MWPERPGLVVGRNLLVNTPTPDPPIGNEELLIPRTMILKRTFILIHWALGMSLVHKIALLVGALVCSVANTKAQENALGQWVTLGTSGGPPVHVERSQIANALVVGDAIYLFDAGDGVRRQMAFAGLPEARIKAIFLSHHHPDHNADVGPVMISHQTFGSGVMSVIGPEGTSTLVAGLVQANQPTELASFPTGGPKRPSLAQSVHAIETGSPAVPVVVFRDENIEVEAIGVPHFQVAPSVALPRMPQAVAYRIRVGGKIIAYSGDSGPTDQLVAVARDADLFVTEVVEPAAIARQLSALMVGAPAAARESIINGMTHNHLVPGEIGRIAQAAKVKKVVLTHFVPSPEAVDNIENFTRDIHRQFNGDVVLANDLDRFTP